jgi:biopolymer transport protein ExbD
MSMSVKQEGGDDEAPMSEINTTPLVDVMLVLLIVFLITIPVVTETQKVDLPRTPNIETETKPENINLSITADGDLFLGAKKLEGYEQLRDYVITRVREAASANLPQPEVHIRADRQTRYESVGRAIVAVQRGGIAKVGFITEPPPRG